MCKTRHQDAALSVLLLRLHLFFHCAHSAGVLTGAKIRLFVHKPTKKRVKTSLHTLLHPFSTAEMRNAVYTSTTTKNTSGMSHDVGPR